MRKTPLLRGYLLLLSGGLLVFEACSSRRAPHLQEEIDMQYVTSTDGTIIGYRQSGSGPPLLLVHGTTADHTRWSGISSELERHFTVYAMDRRGRGGSTDAPDHALMREAADVAAVLEAIDEPAFVVGHSYGALCSLEAALLTGGIRRMILYEPPIPTGLPMYPPGVPGRMQTLIDSGNNEEALEVFMQEVVGMSDRELDAYRRLPMWTVRIRLAPTIPREMAIDRDYRFDPGKFGSLEVPTLLLVGGDSPPLFRRATSAVASALPNSTVVSLDGQQHVAMDTDPDLFVREVLRFLLEFESVALPVLDHPS
jgi:pimeloyl-ACP methyl ester carboxylesterase